MDLLSRLLYEHFKSNSADAWCSACALVFRCSRFVFPSNCYYLETIHETGKLLIAYPNRRQRNTVWNRLYLVFIPTDEHYNNFRSNVGYCNEGEAKDKQQIHPSSAIYLERVTTEHTTTDLAPSSNRLLLINRTITINQCGWTETLCILSLWHLAFCDASSNWLLYERLGCGWVPVEEIWARPL